MQETGSSRLASIRANCEQWKAKREGKIRLLLFGRLCPALAAPAPAKGKRRRTRQRRRRPSVHIARTHTHTPPPASCALALERLGIQAQEVGAAHTLAPARLALDSRCLQEGKKRWPPVYVCVRRWPARRNPLAWSFILTHTRATLTNIINDKEYTHLDY